MNCLIFGLGQCEKGIVVIHCLIFGLKQCEKRIVVMHCLFFGIGQCEERIVMMHCLFDKKRQFYKSYYYYALPLGSRRAV